VTVDRPAVRVRRGVCEDNPQKQSPGQAAACPFQLFDIYDNKARGPCRIRMDAKRKALEGAGTETRNTVPTVEALAEDKCNDGLPECGVQDWAHWPPGT
jgi:hypothetical protein